MSGDAFLAACRQAIGAAQVLTADGDTAAYATDWRRRYVGRPRAVLRPATTGEVAQVVGLCGEYGVPIVPQGGNTGMCGGATPGAGGDEVVLSLARLNRVRAVDPGNATITAEAGCTLVQVQRAAAEAGWLFPLSMGSEGSCTIGGNLATNAGGIAVLRYGNARELCLGLEVVTADGRVWEGLKGLRKDNTGYDLRDLFIGAEGTLGIITAAVLRLFPRPAAKVTAMAAVADARSAQALLAHAQGRCGSGLTAFELLSASCLETVAGLLGRAALPWTALPAYAVLLDLSDSDGEGPARARMQAMLAEALDAGIATDAVLAESLDQAARLWRLRESVPEAQTREGRKHKYDVSVPISSIASAIEAVAAAVDAAAPGARTIVFGHVGDGNLHLSFAPPHGADEAAWMRRHEEIDRCVFGAVAGLQGSISAEHGIGQANRDALRRYKTPLELELMRHVKRALDPRGLLNPGKLL